MKLRALVHAVCMGPIAAAVADAQQVSPPVAEYAERARAQYEIANVGITPTIVVLEPYGFVVDTLGNIVYVPFDSTQTKLRLATMTVRLTPRSSFGIAYEASAEHLPAWFVITNTFTGARTPGLNVRYRLPHVVYLNQREPLARNDVKLASFQFDSARRLVRLRVENVSSRLGRLQGGTVRGGSISVDVPNVPLFPHWWRWIEIPWPTRASAPPERVTLAFEGFRIEAARGTSDDGTP